MQQAVHHISSQAKQLTSTLIDFRVFIFSPSSGHHRPLSDLSELPLQQCLLLLLLDGELFFFQEPFFPNFFVFASHFFNTYEHAVVEHLPQAQHSTAQHSTAPHSTAQRNQGCTKQQSKYMPIGARKRKQAGRVGESREPAWHRAYLHNLLCSQIDRRNLNLPGTQINKTTHKKQL